MAKNRITEHDLRQMVVALAIALDRPQPEQYGVKDSFHLDAAYGGWQLQEYTGDGIGTIRAVTNGYETKRKLWEYMWGMSSGIARYKNRQQ